MQIGSVPASDCIKKLLDRIVNSPGQLKCRNPCHQQNNDTDHNCIQPNGPRILTDIIDGYHVDIMPAVIARPSIADAHRISINPRLKVAAGIRRLADGAYVAKEGYILADHRAVSAVDRPVLVVQNDKPLCTALVIEDGGLAYPYT
ncbi:hypothetical protein D3C73_1016740 [compost metagenome]